MKKVIIIGATALVMVVMIGIMNIDNQATDQVGQTYNHLQEQAVQTSADSPVIHQTAENISNVLLG